MGRGTKLQENEKFTINLLKGRGESVRAIARTLNRSQKVILNFLKDPEEYGTNYTSKYNTEPHFNRLKT